jgi:hypothetical protein
MSPQRLLSNIVGPASHFHVTLDREPMKKRTSHNKHEKEEGAHVSAAEDHVCANC